MPLAQSVDAGETDAYIEDAHVEDAHVEDAHVDDAHVDDAHVDDAHVDDAGPAPATATWAHIGAGSFEMGCSPNDTDCYSDESPVHTVAVAAFEMMSTEITNTQMAAFLTMHGNLCDGVMCIDSEAAALRLSESAGHWSVDLAYANHPVVEITWYGARAFCAAMGGRLPNEAEWEYADRAGTTTSYDCGDDLACLDAMAWYNSNAGGGPHAVGEKTANAFALYDMSGNVWEWTEDSWHDDYTGAPNSAQVWTGGANENSLYRVLRGGSWSSSPRNLRASNRSYGNPGHSDSYYGARCAR